MRGYAILQGHQLRMPIGLPSIHHQQHYLPHCAPLQVPVQPGCFGSDEALRHLLQPRSILRQPGERKWSPSRLRRDAILRNQRRKRPLQRQMRCELQRLHKLRQLQRQQLLLLHLRPDNFDVRPALPVQLQTERIARRALQFGVHRGEVIWVRCLPAQVPSIYE